MKTILLLALTAATLFAADATGTWTGSLIVPREDGTERESPAHLVLKQDGTKLTGTAGPNADEQHPIQGGKVEDGAISFAVEHGESVMKFVLKLTDAEIRGDVSREREGKTDRAKLAVKRQASAAETAPPKP